MKIYFSFISCISILCRMNDMYFIKGETYVQYICVLDMIRCGYVFNLEYVSVLYCAQCINTLDTSHILVLIY